MAFLFSPLLFWLRIDSLRHGRKQCVRACRSFRIYPRDMLLFTILALRIQCVQLISIWGREEYYFSFFLVGTLEVIIGRMCFTWVG